MLPANNSVGFKQFKSSHIDLYNMISATKYGASINSMNLKKTIVFTRKQRGFPHMVFEPSL
jgi:hypothetical protein